MASAKHNVTITYNSDIRGLQSAESELRRLEKMIDQIEADPVDLAGNTPQQLNLLKKQFMDLQVAVARFKNVGQEAFRDYNADATVANREMSKLTNQHRRLTEELRAQARAQEALNKGEDRRLSVLSRTRRALGQSFLEAPLYSASFAVMAGLGAAIQQFIEFDKVLTRIGIVSERSAESMKTFKDMAIETGKALGTTGKAFADASLIFIQQGGLAADNATALAEASIKLANITGARAEDTSDYITAIANSFNMLETDGARAGERIVDMLAELDAATGTSADEIANAFKKSASSFAVSGFSPEQSAAMLAVISETTRQAPELIGTGMKTLIGNLAEVRIGSKEFEGITNKLQDLTKQFGISFSLVDEYTGDVKDVKTLLDEVAQIYSTVNSNAAKNALIEAIAGKEQRDRFIALVENWDRVAEVTDIATNSTGAAQKANERYLDSIGAKIEIVKADLEAFVNELLSSEFLKDLLDTTSLVIQNFTTLIQEGNAFVNILEKIAVVAAPLAMMKMFGGAGGIGGALAAGGGLAAALSQAGGVGGAARAGFMGALGGGAYASATPGQREAMEAGTVNEEMAGQIRNRQIGRAVGGGLIAGAFAVPGIISTVKNDDLLASEKTLNVIGQLLPVIGAMFGPVGILVGTLGSLAISFFAVNEAAAEYRSEMNKLETSLAESMEANFEEIRRLQEVVTRSGIDTSSAEYLQSANKLAELMPELAVGQDRYGNSILRSTELLDKMIRLKEIEMELAAEEAESTLKDKMEIAQEGVEKNRKTLQMGGLSLFGGAMQLQTEDILAEDVSQTENFQKFVKERLAMQKGLTVQQIEAGDYQKEMAAETQLVYEQLMGIYGDTFNESRKELAQASIEMEKAGIQLEVYGDKYIDDLITFDKVLKKSATASAEMRQGVFNLLYGGEEGQTRTLTVDKNQFVGTAEQIYNQILQIDNQEARQKALDEFFKLFYDDFQKSGAAAANRSEFKTKLSSGFSLQFERFLEGSKESQIDAIERNGFKEEDYDEVAEAVYGNTEGLRKAFETLTEEQKELMMSGGDLGQGVANPLQDLFSRMGKLDSSAAQSNIKTQLDGIIGSIRDSKKPLAEQFQDLIDLQLDFIKIQTWLDAAGITYDDTELAALDALDLKFLDVQATKINKVEQVWSEHFKKKINVSSLVDSLTVSARQQMATPEATTTTGGAKRDPIADILGMFDTERAQRQRAIAEAEEKLAGLNEKTKQYRTQLEILMELRSKDADSFVKENNVMMSELDKYQNSIKLTESKITALQEKQKKDPTGAKGIFTVADREQLDLAEKLLDAQKKLVDEKTKLVDISADIVNLEAQQKSLESRLKLFKDGSKEQRQVVNATTQNLREQINLTKELKRSNIETIKTLRNQLKGKMTAAERSKLQTELNEKLALDAQYTNDILADEEAIYNLKKLSFDTDKENISTNIAKLESQLGNRLEQSAEYLQVQDMIIEQQKQMYARNEKRLIDIDNILKTQKLSEYEKALYIKEQNQLYIEQRNLMDEVNESIKKRAVDEYNITLYGTANMEVLQSQYEMRQRLLDEVIDAHEQLVERTQLELEIQKEIEESTDQTYKTNLKYLQSKLKDVKLTKQIIDSTRAQINLLKVLSGEQTSGPLRLTRAPSGQYRFAPTAGGEDGRQASMQAAAEFEKESISRYREISDNIFNLEQQIPQMLLRGEDVSRAQSLLGELRTQRNAQAEDVVKSKTISALVAEGKSNIASRLIAGRMTTAQAAQVLSPQQREGIIASAQGEFDSLISSEQLLVQSNFSIVTSNYKLIDALKAFNLKLAAGFNTPEMSQIRGAASGAMPILDYGKGEAKTVRENVENIQKLQDRAFLESELVRTLNVIANRDAAGMNTDAQKRYLDQLDKRLAGTWIQGEWEKKVTAPGFKFETGGYTGDFSGGKLAMLHEKELVLNKMDTKNILDAVGTVRSFMPSIGSGFTPMLNKDSINGNQNITINADFPNVSSADEIKKAFASMSTKAMQYAYTTKSY
jgi:TP901 family phage tail tape measure protein